MAGSKFSMEALLTLTDRLTGPYRNSTQRITALNRGLSGSFKKLNAGIKKTVGAVGRQMKRAAFVGLGAMAVGVGLAAREFVKLDASITQAGAKFKDLDTTSQTYKDTLGQLSTAARAVGAATEFSATDAAGALDKMAMAGLTSEQSMALLMGTTNLATAAGTDLTTAVDIATDSLGAFGLMTEDSTQLTKNLARVSDVMAKVTTETNTDLEMLFETAKKGAPAMTAAGQEIETFGAIAGRMAASGIKASDAGTAIATSISRLAKNKQALDMLSELNVEVADSSGNFRNMVDILSDVETATKDLGTQEKAAAVATIFGDRAWKSFLPLLSEGIDKTRELETTLINATGASKTMAEAIRGSFGNQIKVLKSGLTELGLQFIEAFEEQGRGALSSLISFVQGFDMEPVIKAVKKVGRFILKTFKAVKSIFKDLQPVLFQTGKALLKIINMLIPLIIPAFKLLGETIGVILPVVNSLVDFVGDLIEEFKQSGAAEKMVTVFSRLKEVMKPIIATFVDIISTVKEFIIESGLMNLIPPILDLFVSGIRTLGGAFKLMWAVAKPILNAMKTLLEPIIFLIEKIITGYSKIGGGVGNVLGGIGDVLLGKNKKETTGGALTEPGNTRGSRGLSLVESTSSRGRAAHQQKIVEQQRITQENTQRQDIYLHSPIGAGISGEPGGEPELAIRLGVQ